MATTISKYNTATKMIMGGIDLDTSTLKLALVTSTYVFNATHETWAEASSNEVATGNGYTTGGSALTSPTLVQAAGVCTFDAADVTFAALTKTFRGGVVYAEGTFETVINPVLFYILFDSTPADRVIEAIDFVVKWNSSGILAI